MTRTWLVIGSALALVAAACTGGESEAEKVSGTEFTAAELTYGLAPPKHAEGMEYQDDVVIVGNGAESVHGMSDDGLMWTIDGDATGIDDVEVGQIMFVTGRVVGRVLKIEDEGDDKNVVLGPVELTEIYRELDVSLDQPVDFGAMPLIEAPARPGTGTDVGGEGATDAEEPPEATDPVDTTGTSPAPSPEPTPETAPETVPDTAPETLPDAPPVTAADTVPDTSPDTTPETTPNLADASVSPGHIVELPTVQLIAAPRAPADLSIRDMNYKPLASQNGLGLDFRYNRGGLRMNGYLFLSFVNPRLRGLVKIDNNGNLSASLSLTGAAGIRLHFDAASEAGLSHNVHDTFVLPAEISIPITGLAAPFELSFSHRFHVNTALSAKNTTLSATGAYDLVGSFSLEFNDGRFDISGPSRFGVRESLVQTLDGVSVGVNGVVLAHAVRAMVGLGALGFRTGPYVDVRSSFGLTNGSDLGIVKCRGGSLRVWLAGGVGYQIPGWAADAINAFFDLLGVKEHIQPVGGPTLFQQLLITKDALFPDLKICREGVP